MRVLRIGLEDLIPRVVAVDVLVHLLEARLVVGAGRARERRRNADRVLADGTARLLRDQDHVHVDPAVDDALREAVELALHESMPQPGAPGAPVPAAPRGPKDAPEPPSCGLPNEPLEPAAGSRGSAPRCDSGAVSNEQAVSTAQITVA